MHILSDRLFLEREQILYGYALALSKGEQGQAAAMLTEFQKKHALTKEATVARRSHVNRIAKGGEESRRLTGLA